MADITFASTPIDGNVVDPDELNDNTYKPSVPASSFAELNGLLGKPNMKTADWKVRSGLIRARALGDGRMIGSTMNLDYLSVLATENGDDPGAYTPIPGAAMNFYLPRRPSVCWITWQLVSAVDMGINIPQNVTKFRLYIDGDRKLAHDRQQVPSTLVPGNRSQSTDRVWSGSFMFSEAQGTSITKGWHSAHLAFWGAGYGIRNAAAVAAGGVPEDFGGMCRFRVRNMKMLWIR